MVRAFPLYAVMPTETREEESDYERPLRAVVQDRNPPLTHIHVVDEFPVSRPRESHSECIVAVEAELNGLLSRDVFKLVQKGDLPPKANLLTGCIIWCIKTSVCRLRGLRRDSSFQVIETTRRCSWCTTQALSGRLPSGSFPI